MRKAIATAMPRQQIVDRVVKDANDDADVLDNTMWMTNQKQYVPNWSMYPATGDVDAANDDARRGRLDAAAPTACAQKDGVKLAFTVGTTTGNQAREFSEQIIQEQLKKIGVKLTIKNSPDMLDTKIVGFDYETIIFAWVGSPDPVQQQRDLAVDARSRSACSPRLAKAEECDYSGQNYTKTQGPDARRRSSTPPTRSPTRSARAALYNQADLQLATNDVTVVPLFQKPTQLGYRNTITGVQDNPTAGRLHLEHRRLGRTSALTTGVAASAELPRSASPIRLPLETRGERVRRTAAAGRDSGRRATGDARGVPARLRAW